MTSRPRYAELHAHSAFSFLDGASTPEALVAEACRLEVETLAVTDHDGLYGVVQLAQAARGTGVRTVFGAEVTLNQPDDAGRASASTTRRTGIADPPHTHLVILANDPEGYRRLSAVIADAALAAGGPDAAVRHNLADLASAAGGHWTVLTGCRKGAVRRALEPVTHTPPATPHTRWDVPAARRQLDILVDAFGRDAVAVELTDQSAPGDDERCDVLADLARAARVRALATGNVHYARPQDADLAGALAAVRAGGSLASIDGWLPAGPGAWLRSPQEMAERHARRLWALESAVELADACAFDLNMLAPQLPPFPVPAGHDEASWLRHLVACGARERYGPPEAESVPGAYARLAHELDVICALNFPGYFLVVHEIVEFCRSRGILAQGRGSAATSAVCYALGVTAVDAVRHNLLFERFLSPERDGPPDIDVDIESARRDEVIQHVYERYGRRHAAQVANVIGYRPRSAVRDAARAFGYDPGQQDAWAKKIERWGTLRDGQVVVREWGTRQLREQNADDDLTDIPAPVLNLAERMMRLPRHLGIHSGGMVMCDRPVVEVCPVQWARTPGRTVLQWDKDDCADAGLVKFDLLGLGMLTALRLSFESISAAGGPRLELHELPDEDPAVYDLLCAADTVGVFQVESRAQMATLPRIQPRCFYDIVVAVALVRPGPIQGGSVHPYIARRRGREPVTYAHPLLEEPLRRTLGVPLFQEQLMQIAVAACGFTAAEADQLRRAMGAKRSRERIGQLRERVMSGMAEHGVPQDVAEQIYHQLEGFADFGFPESHAFSFAYLVYASAWLKVHHPVHFYVGLLSAQPMGFYSPQTLVADARRHGVTVAPVCVQCSQAHASAQIVRWDAAGECELGCVGAAGGRTGADARAAQAGAETRTVLRLGLDQVRGITRAQAEQIVAERERGGPLTDLDDAARRLRLTRAQWEGLAGAGALAHFGVDRRRALWLAGPLAAVDPMTLPGLDPSLREVALPAPDERTTLATEAWATSVNSGEHPMARLRDLVRQSGAHSVTEVIGHIPTGRRVMVVGVVTHRQRPGTAHGVTFLSLEDETGLLNVICSPGLWRRFRTVARTASALAVRGRVERADGATNLVAEHLSAFHTGVAARSRDFQ